VYVCEIKFSKSQLQRAVISEVDRKIRSIAKPRNYTFRPVLIHVNGVDDSVLEEPKVAPSRSYRVPSRLRVA
jgi:uncharacterized protein